MKLLDWIAALLFSILLTIVLWQGRMIYALEARPAAYKQDVRLVHAAMRQWSSTSKEPLDWMAQNRFPVVVHLNGATCVELRLLVGSLGGNPSYCFSNTKFQIIHKNEEVE